MRYPVTQSHFVKSLADGGARRLRYSAAVALLVVFSVGCAVSNRVALPPLPQVALLVLEASRILASASAGAPYTESLMTTGGVAPLTACQFLDPSGTMPGTNVVPLGITIIPSGTTCMLGGTLDPTVQSGTYTFRVRAADNSSPPLTDTETYTINVNAINVAVTSVVNSPSVTGETVTVTFTISFLGPTPSAGLLTATVTGGIACTGISPFTSVVPPPAPQTVPPTPGVATGDCTITFPTAGPKTIMLSYSDPAYPATVGNPATTTVNHTVNAASTTLTVTPPGAATVTGQPYTVNFTVAAVAPGALVAPTGFTGTVLISDGLDTCTGNVAANGTGSCVLTSTTNGGPKTLNGTYTPAAGDNNFLGSMGSAAHTVNMASTTTTVTPVPTPSVTGQAVTVNVTVATNAPGMGEPTGTVPVDDGTGATCTVTLTPGAAGSNMSTGSCLLTPTTAGNKTLTGIYSGDANFATSTGTQAHTVNPAATTTTITSDAPDPSITGQTYTVTVTVDTTAPGTGQATGTVNVADGQGQSCMIALAAGPGANQSSGNCLITSLTTAVTTLTANYLTDGNYAASSDTEAHVVSLAPTTTTITSDTPDPSAVGQPITVNFTVASVPPGSGEPTGTVTVSDGFLQSCMGALTPGAPGSNMSTGTCMVTSMNIGVNTLTANYSGDTNFAVSSDTEAHAMTAGATTTTITADAPDPSVTGQSYTVNVTVDVVAPATGNPTGNVTITDGLGGTCMAVLANGPGANQSSGSCAIMSTSTAVTLLAANYPGDTNFGASMDTETHTVSPSPTTTTITSDTPDPSVTGESITMNVTVAPTGGGMGEPTGTVTISDGAAVCMAALIPGAPGSNMSTGSCSFASDSGTAPGTNKTLTANYGGDLNFAASAGNTAHTTNRANTTTAVTPPGVATVSGEAYTVNVIVNSVAPGAGAPLGNVTIDDGEGNNCLAALMAVGPSQSSGSCMLTSQSNGVPGKTITGNFPLSPSFNGSVDTAAHTVNPASTTTTLMSSVSPSVFGQPVTFTATVSANAPGSGTPTGTVDFVDTTTGTSLCTAVALAGASATCMVSNLAVGTHQVQATYNGDPDFNVSSSALFAQMVNQASSAITVLSKSVDPTVTGQPYTVNITVSAVAPGAGEPTGTVTVDDGDGITCMAVLTPGAPGSNMSTGSCGLTSQSNGVPLKTLSANYPGDANFLGTANAVAHTVNPAATTTTITSDAPDPSDITTPYTVNVTVTTNAPGAGEPTGSVTVDDGSGTATTCLAPLIPGLPGSNMSTGSCILLTTVRSPVAGFTLAAAYTGDPDFAVSVGNDQHVVMGIPSSTTITTDVPDPTIFGEPYSVSVQVVSASPFFTPTGTVTVDDGIGGTCMAVLVPTLPGISTGNCMIASMPGATPVVLNLTATYPGDPTFEPSASGGADTHTVNQASTTTLINSDAPDPSQTGESYSVNVTVAPVAPATGAPTGTVTIDDGDGNSCMAALVGGVNQSTGSCLLASTIAPSGAAKTLTANYPGDATFSGSVDNDGHTVNQGNSTVTVTTNSTSSGAGASVSGETFDVDVTVAATNPAMGEPTGSVDVNDGLGAVCTIAALTPGAPGSNMSTGTCQLTLVVAGSTTRTITATYNGDTEFVAGDTGNTAHDVNPSPTTTTLIANGDVNTVTGEQYTVMVTVTSSGGGMGEPDGDVDVDDGEGNTCNTGALTQGAPGSNMSTGSCMLTSSANAPSQLKTITGNYNPGGSGEFATSTGTDPHTVNEAATATVINDKQVFAVSQNTTVSGEDYDVLVTVTTTAPGMGEPTGTVLVQDDSVSPTDTCVAALTPGAPGSNMSTGTCTMLTSRAAGMSAKNMVADYQADPNFAVSTSATFAHTVNKAFSGIFSFTKTNDPSVVGETYTVDVTIGASTGEGEPTGTVTANDGFGGSCLIALVQGAPGSNQSTGSCLMASTTVASNNIDISYAGDAEFNAAGPSGFGHTVNAASTMTTVITSPSTTGPGGTYAANVVVTSVAPGAGEPSGDVDVDDGIGNTCVATLVPGAMGSNMSTGTCNLTSTPGGPFPVSLTVTAQYDLVDADPDFNTSSGNVLHTIDVVMIGSIALGDGVEGRMVGTGTSGLAGVRFPITGGSAPYTCTDPGTTLPAGITVALAVTGTDCELQGGPAGGSAGAYMVDITVTDMGGAGTSATTGPMAWNINLPLAITDPAGLADAVEDRNYALTFDSTMLGGIGPYTWSEMGASLGTGGCAGFAINAAGDLTGTAPLVAGGGTCNFTAQVADSASTTTMAGTATQAETIIVNQMLTIVTTTLPNAKVASTYLPISLGGAAVTGGPVISATGGFGVPFTYNVTSGSFTNVAGVWTGDAATPCEGLSFNEMAFDAGSGNAVDTVVNGSPVNPGSCVFTIEVSDLGNGATAAGTSGGQSLTVIVLGTFGYVTASANNTLQVFNTSTNAFTTSIALAASPDQVAITRDGRFVVVTLPTSDQVEVIDVTTNALVAGSPFTVGPTCDEPRGVATNDLPGIKPRAYIVCTNNDVAIGIDLDPADVGTGAFGAINDSYLDISNGDPLRIAFMPNGQRFYVSVDLDTATADTDGEFSVIDVVDAGLGVPGPIAGSPFAFPTTGADSCEDVIGLAIAVSNRVGNPTEVWFACSASGDEQVLVYDTATNTLTVNNTAPTTPNSIAFIPGSPAIRAHVTETGSDTLEAVDTDDGTTDNTIALAAGAAPLGVVVEEQDPAPGTGFRVYVAFSGVVTGNSNKVGVFNDANPPTANAANPVTLQAATNLVPRAVVVVIIPRPATP